MHGQKIYEVRKIIVEQKDPDPRLNSNSNAACSYIATCMHD